MGLSTGIDLDTLVDAGDFICTVLDRKTESKVARALMANKTDR
jgi:hydroxymethylglutaryl-CoA lyase